MTVAHLRACGRGAVAVLAALTLTTACTSSTSGSGTQVQHGSTGSAPASTPAGGGGGGGASGSGGGGGLSGNFCHDWSTVPQKFTPANMSGVGQNLLAHWDALAAEAPGPIKSDVATLDQYLHAIVSGHPDLSMAASLGTSVRNVITWVAANCH